MKKTLEKQCDDAYSLLRRHQAKDKEGNVKCFTCARRYPLEQMTLGHWQKRRHHGTRYHDINCQPQCMECQNQCETDATADIHFGKLLIWMYGEPKIMEIHKLAHSTVHMSKYDYTMLLEELNKELKKWK